MSAFASRHWEMTVINTDLDMYHTFSISLIIHVALDASAHFQQSTYDHLIV